MRDIRRFLVLLFAFQRFTLKDWGLAKELDSRISHLHEGSAESEPTLTTLAIPTPEGPPTLISAALAPHASAYTLSRRGTVVLEGRIPAQDDMHVAVKIQWPDTSRDPEAAIVRRAKEIAEQRNLPVQDNLPSVIESFDYPYRTLTVRESVDSKSPDGNERTTTPRVFRLMVSAWLVPITAFWGRAFVEHWLQVIICAWQLFSVRLDHAQAPSSCRSLYSMVCRCQT